MDHNAITLNGRRGYLKNLKDSQCGLTNVVTKHIYGDADNVSDFLPY